MKTMPNVDVVIDFYRRRSSWLLLGFTAVVMIYLGGAAAFLLHAVILGEGGPAISPVVHWFVDSTAGVFALTPVLFVLLPFATRYAMVEPGALRPHRFALFGGAWFALATTPGPILHDAFISRGTWLADKITEIFGDGRALEPAKDVPLALSMTYQFTYGLPVYVALMWLVIVLARRAVMR
ncbi:hypothetical protein [Allorhizocola rhizosphaerae]|uniref:hypothetical protein n=1 Tax=Allorhizocola rhizosphaerae TaxID=1872709 RepID=UPI0013C377E1|nr:hypothetical protein [Allorhizocola rhizosphaerae]